MPRLRNATPHMYMISIPVAIKQFQDCRDACTDYAFPEIESKILLQKMQLARALPTACVYCLHVVRTAAAWIVCWLTMYT